MTTSGLVTGQVLGHYRIVERIGAGGMGVVYRAHDERLDRDVALKVLLPGTLADDSARKRFRQEALALSRLNHPNIATVHDFDRQEGIDFLVTELVPGRTLDERLAAGPLPEKEVRQIGLQLADGLEAAHREGVIHGDLKPGNLRLTPEGRVKILDFGLAKRVDPADQATVTQSMSEPDGAAGTLAYMAPEQLKAERVDTRTDLWAAGVALYELATGRRPFQGKTATALANEIFHAAAPSPQTLQPKLSARITDIILKSLEKDPENRYQSAKELAVDLRRLATTTATATAATPAEHLHARAKALATAGVMVAAILAVATYFYVGRTRPAAPRSQITSLAMLPLTNLSGDANQEYFADGVTEALIVELSKVRALKVISRTSAMQYKGPKKPLPQIARELGVDAVMEGSVQREGDQVRISIQLIDAATNKYLWAEQYQREYRSILALQSEVARAIVQQIKITLTPQEQVRLGSAHMVDPQAHEAYLKGRYYSNKRTEKNLKKSIEYFQQAIEKDPNYASAYSGMADAYALLGYRGDLPSKETLSQAKRAALKAVELDDTLAEAHASLAFIAETHEWDWLTAEREYKRALDLNPGYAVGHNWYAGYLMYLGRFDEGIAEAKRARELDPLSLAINNALGGRLLLAGRDNEAIEQIQRTLDMDPNFAPAHNRLGWAYLRNGTHEQAISEFQKAIALSDSPDFLIDLGYTYAVAGNRDQAQKILAQLKRKRERGFASSSALAIVYGALDEKDEAFAWLQKSYEERDPQLTYLKVGPRFDPLRKDPRFRELLRRMNFPQ